MWMHAEVYGCVLSHPSLTFSHSSNLSINFMNDVKDGEYM